MNWIYVKRLKCYVSESISSALFLNPTWHITTCRHTFCIEAAVERRRKKNHCMKDQPQSHIYTCAAMMSDKYTFTMLASIYNHSLGSFFPYLHSVNYLMIIFSPAFNILHKLQLTIQDQCSFLTTYHVPQCSINSSFLQHSCD